MMDKKEFSFFLLRISLGVVFIIFGIGKFTNDFWAETMRNIPLLQMMPISMDALVIIDGTLEILTGLLLVLGLFTRIVSLVASLQLMAVLFFLKFQETRDIVLLAASLAIFLSGSKFLSIDNLRKKYEAA